MGPFQRIDDTVDRDLINFSKELESIENHRKHFERARLGFVVNRVYVPKLIAKSAAAFLYNEDDTAYLTIETPINRSGVNSLARGSRAMQNHKFDLGSEQFILGIEAQVDQVAAGIVSSHRRILSNEIKPLYEVDSEGNPIIKTESRVAGEKAASLLPGVVKAALNSANLNHE